MKLILMPLAVLTLLTVASLTGLGSQGGSIYGQHQITLDYENSNGYYDVSGDGFLYDDPNPATRSIICWYNMTVYYAGNEQGYIEPIDIGNLPFTSSMWTNSSGGYILYEDNGDMAIFDSFGGAAAARTMNTDDPNWSLNGSFGFLALLIGLMAAGTLAGLHFFGSGLSEISIELLFKGAFFIGTWTALTVLSYPLILEGGFIVFLIYFALTLIYTIGVATTVNGDGGSE